MKYDYDVIILGSGPAGFSCAVQSAKLNKKALIIESDEDYFGGSWINAGTLPSKAMRESTHIIKRFQSQFPEKTPIKPYEKYEIKDLLSYKNTIIAQKNKKLQNDLDKNKIKTVKGTASFVDKNTIEAADESGKTKKYTAEYILIATGSSPKPSEDFEVDHNKIYDYSSILQLNHIPRSMVIVGSGVNALEYASIFANLGTRVSILSKKSTFLKWLDHEIAAQLNKILDSENIEIIKNVDKILIKENSLRNTTEAHYTLKNDKEKGRKYVIEIEHALYLGAKVPNTQSLNLKNVGINIDAETFITVDNDMKTSAPNIYAAGDVIGFPRLASVSFLQGRIAACRMFDFPTSDLPKLYPFGIYSIPEISNIGITENEAKEKGLNITVGRAYYKSITQGDISNQQDGLLKIIFDSDTLKILGVHIIGDRAGDLIHLGQAVMDLGGDVKYFVSNVQNYPTFTEAYRIAAFNGLNRLYKMGHKYNK